MVLFWSALVRAVLAAAIPFTDQIWQIAALAMMLAAANARLAAEDALRRRLAAGEASLDILDLRGRLAAKGLTYL